jgi:hypothetical protein
MDRVRWQSTTVSAASAAGGGGSRTAAAGGDLERAAQERAARAVGLAREAAQERIETAGRLERSGLRLQRKVAAHLERRCIALGEGAARVPNACAAAEGKDDYGADACSASHGLDRTGALDAGRMRFYRQGMARRAAAAASAARKRGLPHAEQLQRATLREAVLAGREYAPLERASERRDRIGMKQADAESAELNSIWREAEGRARRFADARAYMQARMGSGFEASPQYGRQRYFAFLGLRRRTERLSLD